ncbi:Tic22 family protein [Okeania sp.]|uniref:Tic22 family protein n=1 Tax=Okeania sp. TaxID=3100323 RepID=UPI002B4ACA9C|nr:Tic22 family protein [Okeania sp.]MEB3341314.1 Tic22 family protein [Okeania sp.]
MKSLTRLSAVLGIVASSLIGPSLKNMSALALPDQEVLQKLTPVPVFTVTDKNGSPLVASIKGKDDKGNASVASVAGVFISKSDADAFVNKLKGENSDLAATVKVVPVSLGEVYEMSKSAQQNGNKLQFAYVPIKKQVESAKAVLKQNGKDANQFNGVPLFMAKGGADDGYLTIQRGEQQVIPMFFNKEDLQGMLDRAKSKQPDIFSSVKIEVVNLEGVIQALKNDNDPFLEKIIFIPPRESLEFVQKLRQSGGSGNR